MLLTERAELPVGPEWGYEAKLDGYRMMAEVSPERIRLTSRHGNDFTQNFPAAVTELPLAFNGLSVVLDGEMVGHNASGQPSFSALRRKHSRGVYYIFDLLELGGEPLIGLPLRERREQLQNTLAPTEHVRVSEMFYDRDAMVRAAREHGMEGVVAKKLDSTYRPGVRSPNWLKMILIRHLEGFGRT